MYEAVHARPDGDATVARLALTAAEQGFSGIVVRNHTDARVDTDEFDVIATETGVDVVPAVEIRAPDPSRASGYVGNVRREVPVVCVHGGDSRLNRFGVGQSRVDVLAHPTTGEGRVDHVVVKTAAANDVALELSLADVLRADGGHRVRAISALRTLADLVEKYDAPYVLSADPSSHLELRAPRELFAVGEAVGLSREQVAAGLERWSEIASRNRHRLSDSVIEPGVEVGRYEETSMAERGEAESGTDGTTGGADP